MTESISTKVTNLGNSIHHKLKEAIITQDLSAFCRYIDIIAETFPSARIRYIADGVFSNDKEIYEKGGFTCGTGRFHLYLNTLELGQPVIIDGEVEFEYTQRDMEELDEGPFTPEIEINRKVYTKFLQLLRDLLIFQAGRYPHDQAANDSQYTKILGILEKITMEMT